MTHPHPAGAGQSTNSQFAPPDAVAEQHARRLLALIDERLATDGAISFADYMELVLYSPGLGYYMAGAQKFGAGGDFTTAPEVSPLFGACLAAQVSEVLITLGVGDVLELGAGSGNLACSLITNLDAGLLQHYFILEPSAELQQRQQHYLAAELDADTFSRLHWLQTLPTGFKGVVVANEVLDAMPVERFRKSASGEVEPMTVVATDRRQPPDLALPCYQSCHTSGNSAIKSAGNTVPNTDGKKTFDDKYDDKANLVVAAVAQLEQSLGYSFAPGYESEVNLLLSPWLTALADSVSEAVVLLIDYGYPQAEYYLPERERGTVMCYYQHRAHSDPFIYPGLQDVTAHVDFTRVATAALDNDLELLGYATQSAFLLDNGITELAADALASAQCEADRIAVTQAIKTLTLPGEMGERFQVMALGKGYDAGLRGFQSHDLSHRL